MRLVRGTHPRRGLDQEASRKEGRVMGISIALYIGLSLGFLLGWSLKAWQR